MSSGQNKRRPFRGLPPRGSKAVSNGKGRVNGPGVPDAPPPRTDADVRSFMVAHQPVQLSGKSKIRLDAPQNPAATLVMIHDPQAQCWRPILLPPGSRYVLQPDAEPRPQLWLPPGAKA